MTLLQALLLGVLQGVTEFLPVSSSGHLALVQRFMPGISTPFLLFEVVVHLGTLCAIGLVLRARILALGVAARSFLPGSVAGDPVDRRWIALIALASVPTAAIGLALRGPVEVALHRPALVGGALLVTAVLLLVSERIGRRERGPEELRAVDALWIGVAQGVSVFPGISRSGATIAAGLWRDARGEVAVEFSLLASMPAVAGATLLVAVTGARSAGAADLAPLVVGFASAFGTGVLALRGLQWVVAKRRLLPFAGYCGLVGAGAIALG